MPIELPSEDDLRNHPLFGGASFLTDSAPVHQDHLRFDIVRTVGTNPIRLRTACHPRSLVSLTTVLMIGSLLAVTGVDLTAQASVEQKAPITGLGGYTWPGSVDSIAAQWRVPTVASSSHSGLAATWIGAQNVNGPTPFIQLGTFQMVSEGAATCEVFWSDYSVDDQPQSLGSCAGGDVLAASMTRTASGWKLVARDETTNTTLTKTVAYDTGGSFSQGEWLQEDPPTSSVPDQDGPYPRTSTVAFEQVKVNGTVPTLALANEQALLAADDVFLVPTSFSNDGFELVPAKGLALRYLTAAARLDRVTSAYAAERSKWASVNHRARVTDLQRVIAAIHHFDRSIEQTHWRPATRRAMLGLTRAGTRVARALERWARADAPLQGSTFRSQQKALTRWSKLAVVAEATLGLPPA